MFRASRLGELLTGIPRPLFNELVEKHDSDKHCKGFNSWSHLLAMVYAQLSGARSLRQMETGYNAQVHQHYHLGVGLSSDNRHSRDDRLRRDRLPQDNRPRRDNRLQSVTFILMP